MDRTWRAIGCTLLLCLGLAAGQAAAQAYPARPIMLVVPFGAGGSVDVLARLLGPKMSEGLGQPIVVEYRPGAGGMVGAGVVARSAPDGYTMLLIPNALAIGPALYRKLPFDPAKDLQPVTQLIGTHLVLVSKTSLPAHTVPELIALARSKPGTLNYGSTGAANPLHLTMELFKTTAGVDIVSIFYKGDGPVNAALMGGEVDVAVIPLAAGAAHIKSGKLRALGLASARRSAAYPDLPTIAETLPGFELNSWQGFFVAAGTPRPIVARLQTEAVKALNTPEVREKLPALGQDPVGSTPEEFEVRYRADVQKFAKIVKDARIPPQD